MSLVDEFEKFDKVRGTGRKSRCRICLLPKEYVEAVDSLQASDKSRRAIAEWLRTKGFDVNGNAVQWHRTHKEGR